MESNQGTDLLTPAQVAAVLGVSKATALRQIEAGDFEAFRVGPAKKRIRVTRVSVDEYRVRNTIAPAASAA